MKIAFTIFKYFPHGGLQLDFRRIVAECLRRGHQITVFCREWDAPPPAHVRIVHVNAPGWSNHAKAASFECNVAPLLTAGKFDVICGFNRMRGLDVYFAADDCLGKRTLQLPWYRRCLTSRYTIYERMERSVFAPAAHTTVMALTQRQLTDYRELYATPVERFRLLPPGIEPDRQRPSDAARRNCREEIGVELGFDATKTVLLQICSGFNTKGVDRTIKAVAALPPEVLQRTVCLIAGREKNPKFRNQAAASAAAGSLIFCGGRSDVGKLLCSTDLMVHPARNEATGTVLAEAIAAGVPAICSGICGYASYTAEAGGFVLSEPFSQHELNIVLRRLLATADRSELARAASSTTEYGRKADFYRRAALAADIIEESAPCAVRI